MVLSAREKAKRKKRDKRKATGKFHSAATGEYVDKEFAAANPDLVVEETGIVNVNTPADALPDEGAPVD